MLSHALVVLATAASLSYAATPAGFEPSSQNNLFVTYGNLAAQGGMVMARDCELDLKIDVATRY
jgi:hypothetical protein